MSDQQPLEWTEERALQLIDLYRERPALWNQHVTAYHLKHLKFDAWCEIGKILNVTVESVKTKITSMLSSYRREKAKVGKSKGTGKGKDISILSVLVSVDDFAALFYVFEISHENYTL